jgi:hypothetical protein
MTLVLDDAVDICPGCGVVQAAGDWIASGRGNASAGCELLLSEITGYESQHPELARCHQLTVDTYGAQHAGGGTKQIRVAYSLVGLHLALDRGISGIGVRTAHSMMGKPRPDWPVFDRPASPGTVTVRDVAEAGARADSVPGHAAAVTRWAVAVWGSFAGCRADVVALTDRLFTGTEPFWGQQL